MQRSKQRRGDVFTDYGVPQIRERLFVVATRARNGFRFPERTHAPKEDCNALFPLKPYVGAGEVIADLGKPAPNTTKYLRLHRNKPANTLRCGEIFK